ncbi:MAG: cytochrome C biogenesis protein [Actinobacteria bacterium]|nr:cytochrome C biogenesis protein [Actinomycetota bacterium]
MAAVVPGADLIPIRPRGVATRSTRAIGALAAVLFAWVLVGGLWLTPADQDQGDSVRIMYVHVPSAWVAYLAFVVTAVASACYLLGRRRPLGFDRVAGASAEVGVLFMALALVSGSLWGRPTWGTFWVWDPRLTTTAFLFVTYVGYLAVRGTGATPEQRARRSAVLALLAVLEIPLVHFSVVLWRSLHQQASVLSPDGDVKMDGSMLFTLFTGVVAFTSLFAWLVVHRQRVQAMSDALAARAIDDAIASRGAAG